jgi:uncharacterized protein RhaS with RHS repeats
LTSNRWAREDVPTSRRSDEGDDMANAELITRILTHIEEDLRRLNMYSWTDEDAACGTTACVAGWAVILDGRAAWNADDGWNPPGSTDNGYDDEAWARQGMDALGISEGMSKWLFHTDPDSALRALRELRDGASEVDAVAVSRSADEE